MNKIENIKEKLNLKLNNNNQTIKHEEEKIKDDRIYQKDYNIKNILIYTSYAYLLLIILSTIFPQIVGINTIINTISPYYIPLIISGTSLIIGTLCNTVKNIIVRTKTKKNTNLNNELSHLINELYSKYEIEKIKNENKIIELALNSLNNKQALTSNLDNMEETENKLITSNKELDNLTKQQFILNLKSKNNFLLSLLKVIATTIISFIILCYTYLIPLLIVDYGPILIPTNFIKIEALITLGLSLSTGVYSLYRSVLKNKSIKKLKYLFGDRYNFHNGDYDSLDLKITYKNKKSLNKAIDKKNNDISNLKLELLDQQYQIKIQQKNEIHCKLVEHRTRTNTITPRGQIDIPNSVKAKKKIITGYQTGYKFNQ